jgi:LacI family transcriptional regulator
MKMRVTQSDVARAAGVHTTTVSLALRNSRLIPPATRERIQAVAQSMGYSPDPALRALAAYRNSRRERRDVETLAYITNWETKWGWRNLPAHERYYQAAQRRAADLGYQLEHLWLGEPGMTQRRLDHMLVHRGISGVLLASHRATHDELANLDWSRLSAVKIGCFPHAPVLNQITVNPGSVMRLALRRVLAEGYRRIGLVLPRCLDDLADQTWSGAFHAEQYRSPIKEALPVLYLKGATKEFSAATEIQSVRMPDDATLAHWFRQYRPEVIVGLTPAVLEILRYCGLRTPRDVAYVDLCLQDPGYAVAGVWENCERVGELAVEMLVNQLEQNVFGIPDVATVTSIGGVWREGASLPPKSLPVEDGLGRAAAGTLQRNLVA